MGRDPVRRHGRAAHLHLPEPEVHRVPAQARVRAADPRGRARGPPAKAGTPTMGGIIDLPRRSRAVPDPQRLRDGVDRRLRRAIACALLGFADDYIKLVRRRSLGLRARTKLVGDDRDLDRPVVRRDTKAHLPLTCICASSTTTSISGLLSGADLFRRRRHDRGGQPDRRARRPGRGLRGDRRCSRTSGSRSSRARFDLSMIAGCLVGACIGFLWFNAFPATVFMGDTARSGWAVRSPGWP